LPLVAAAQQPRAADLAAALGQISLDPEQTYNVRELTLSRGDIKIYLTEGILSFLTPVAGRVVGAVFTTTGAEAGDAEVLLMPPQRSERASLASFINRPNLDEHFTSAVFLFSDNTAKELLEQIERGPIRNAPEIAAQLAPALNPVVRTVSSDIDARLVQSLLDDHQPSDGFILSVIQGRDLGTFDVMYDPTDFEPISVGRVAPNESGPQRFQLWTAFRPRRAPAYVSPPPRISEYQVDATIRPDLSMSATAKFKLVSRAGDGRVIPFAISGRLKVASATIDDKPVEVFQRDSLRIADLKIASTFLLVSDTALQADREHTIEVKYEGSVIRQTGDRIYFVDERNEWYPHTGPMLTTFDLTFHCPETLRLVSTGELVKEEVVGGIRTVHRKTPVPERLAGFNLGDYNALTEEKGEYNVECYSNKSSERGLENIPAETESILDYYTARWTKLPIHSLAVSPIPGYFGQGFPGLIYLSTISYIPQEERPTELRTSRMDTFFSQLLLPHEVAHQWWGNVVSAADYRSAWLMEAMANYAALQFLEQTHGAAAIQDILTTFRRDLERQENGKSVESAGPLDFGQRLIQTAGMPAWHTIVYEKGVWILHMLRERLGPESFTQMQAKVLANFTAQPLHNEDFRKAASEFVPAGQPDRALTLFFDTWIYGTGIPKLALERSAEGLNLEVSQVDEDFIADVPLRCRSAGGKEQVRWVRASSGTSFVGPLKDTGSCELPSAAEFLYSP
jgi:hypothetical protein